MKGRLMNRSFLWLGLAVLFVWHTSDALAQLATSSIRGEVQDQAGSPLPGSTVTAELSGTGIRQSTVTDASGRFYMSGLRPGAYTISAELTGFRKAIREGTFLRLREVLDLTFKLELSALEAEIIVTADAASVDITTSAISSGVTTQEIANLPLNDRDFLDLALLTPGVREGRDPTLLGTQVVMGAQDPSATLIATDGVDTTSHFIGGAFQTSIQETIQEYRVVTANFGADIGRTNAGAITVISKSGTNDLTGTVWEYFRDKSLQASGEFDGPNDDYRRHQFGGLVSGPIVQDKTHFLVAFERRDQDLTFNVDTAGTFPELDGDVPNKVETSNLFAKIDQQISDNMRVFLRYTYEQRKTTNSGNLTGFEPSIATESNYFSEDQKTNFILGSHNWTPFANASNQLSLYAVFADRPSVRNSDLQEEIRPSSRQGGFYLAGFSNTDDNSLAMSENFSVQVGSHTLKFGGDLQFRSLRMDFPIFSNSQYTFRCIPGDPFGCSADGPFFIPQDFTDPVQLARYAFGFPVLKVEGVGTPPRYSQDRTVIGVYAQDDWTVGDRLTVSLGVRWDFDSDTLNSSFRSPLLDVPIPGFADALKPYVTPPDRDWNNIAPRFGFTYDLTNDGKTLLRGGWGVFYSFFEGTISLFPTTLSGIRIPGVGQFGSYAGEITILPDYFDPNTGMTFTNPLRKGADPTIAPLIYASDPDGKVPYTMQAALGISRTLTPDIAVTLDYTNALGRNELITVDTNAPEDLLMNDDGTCVDTGNDGYCDYNPLSRPLIKAGVPFGPIRTFKTIAQSTFNSVQMGFHKRMSNDWEMRINYTWSRAERWQDNPTSDVALDSAAVLRGETEQEVAIANVDQTHVFNLLGTYQAPYGVRVGTLLRVGSGPPFEIAANADLNNDGNPNDIAKGTTRTDGRADTYIRWDLRLSKEFEIGNRFKVLVLAEGFNLLNRKNHDPDSYNIIDTGNGHNPGATLNDAYEPLQVQLGMRLKF